MSPICKTLCVLAILAVPAQADWKGARLTWQYYAFGNPYDDLGSPGHCKVRKGRTSCGEFDGHFKVAAEPNAIVFAYTNNGKWSESDLSLPPTVHNGLAVVVNSAGTITAVTIDPETNMQGFGASRISFTAKEIQIDWQNLRFKRNTKVKLHVEFSETPAPPRAKLTSDPPRL